MHLNKQWGILQPGLASVLLVVFLSMGPTCTSHPAPADDAHTPAQAAPPEAVADSSFARLVARLSEPEGYFDTDNLISNEASYLHALDGLRARGVHGGAYLGVGPDQNFSYIAHIRPVIAFIVDIRRDNLLQHVFFKTLFARARNRLDYLCLLLGTPPPDDLAAWDDYPIEELIAYIDQMPASEMYIEAIVAETRRAAIHTGLPLSEADLDAIEQIHRAFLRGGLDLQFASHGRAPQPYYPTLRRLLLETDRAGQLGNYLVREDDFQFLKTMQAHNRIVPVVGNLAGPHTLRAVGAYLDEHNLAVSALYTSNVEFYLVRQGQLDRFAANIQALPRTDASVIIRSYFHRWRSDHPQTLPGYASTQLLQSMNAFDDDFTAGEIRSYGDLIYQPAGSY